VGALGSHFLHRTFVELDVELQTELVHRLDQRQIGHCEVQVAGSFGRVFVEALEHFELFLVDQLLLEFVLDFVRLDLAHLEGADQFLVVEDVPARL